MFTINNFYEKMSVVSYLIVLNYSGYLKSIFLYNITIHLLHISIFLFFRYPFSVKEYPKNFAELFYINEPNSIVSCSFEIKNTDIYLISVSIDEIENPLYYLIDKHNILNVNNSVDYLKNDIILFIEDSFIKFRIKTETIVFVTVNISKI